MTMAKQLARVEDRLVDRLAEELTDRLSPRPVQEPSPAPQPSLMALIAAPYRRTRPASASNPNPVSRIAVA
jgi:hypothetical protein